MTHSEMSIAIKASWAKPEVRAKVAAAMANGGNERRRISMKKTLADHDPGHAAAADAR
jgi:hypothetical protein